MPHDRRAGNRGRLVSAERERKPIVPFSRAQPFLGAGTAYEVQSLFVGHRLQDGERVIGAKLGLTSKVKRDALGIHEPVYGRLASGMIHPFGELLRLDELIHPSAEPEIAFLLGRRIAAFTTLAGVMAATELVFPALEVVDSRYCERSRLPDSIADNAGAAKVILGAQGRSPRELVDLHVLGCLFRWKGGSYTAAGGAVMGHPAAALAWLANTPDGPMRAPRRRDHRAFRCLDRLPLKAGSIATAEFDGPGSVGIRCQ
jgi:2-oxo-3-hexenedioate decarboxylase